jgi:hypothetical protein
MIEEACNSGRMPGSAARRIDTLAVQFFGDGAYARDARGLDDPLEVRGAPLGSLVDLGDSFSVAGALSWALPIEGISLQINPRPLIYS